MNKKNTILSMLLVLAFLMCTGLSLGQGGDETGGSETVAPENASQLNETGAPEQSALNLNYIWSFSNIEEGPVTMLINQEGSELFGQAKYEPDSGAAWNADVIGSLAGDEVELTMTAQKGTELFTTKMTGTYANDAITGNWTQISGGKKVGSGAFMAMWISPDTASYAPAVIAQPTVETPAPAEEETAAQEETEETKEETADPKSRFVDVRQYKDKIGPGGDLSGIPPGMGGAGLN